ncbi:MAG: hypothetical protein KJI72_04040 [Patescibacteria group bacterium]|nr:hypothetical protein [Patescibacteria group bacterium]
MGRSHVEKSRRWLEKYVFPDPFAKLSFRSIKRRDILDLRERLLEKVGPNTVNKVIDTVKTIFSEAYFREEIDRDTGHKIGNVNYEKTKPEYYPLRKLGNSSENDRDISQQVMLMICFTSQPILGPVLEKYVL